MLWLLLAVRTERWTAYGLPPTAPAGYARSCNTGTRDTPVRLRARAGPARIRQGVRSPGGDRTWTD